MLPNILQKRFTKIPVQLHYYYYYFMLIEIKSTSLMVMLNANMIVLKMKIIYNTTYRLLRRTQTTQRIDISAPRNIRQLRTTTPTSRVDSKYLELLVALFLSVFPVISSTRYRSSSPFISDFFRRNTLVVKSIKRINKNSHIFNFIFIKILKYFNFILNLLVQSFHIDHYI